MSAGIRESGFRDEAVEVLSERPFEVTGLRARGKTASERLIDFQVDKVRHDHNVRKILVFGTGVFLVCETLFVFWIVSGIAQGPNGAELQPLLATMVAGTLVQTYGMMRIMVKYYFAAGEREAQPQAS